MKGGIHIHNNNTYAWQRIAKRIKQRDGYTCVYCNSTQDLTVDHILAKANGGTDEDNNLVTACRSCNSTKGTRKEVRLNYYNRRWFQNM